MTKAYVASFTMSGRVLTCLPTVLDWLSPQLQITPVKDGDFCRMDHGSQVAARADQDVEDHVVRRRDLLVAVVPCVLGQFQQIETRRDLRRAEHRFHE